MNIICKFGGETHTLETINQPTVGDLRRNTTLKAILGFGDNVRVLVHEVEQPDHVLVPEDATVVFETRANSKALAVQ